MRPVADGYSPDSSQPLHELLTISFSGCLPATKKKKIKKYWRSGDRGSLCNGRSEGVQEAGEGAGRGRPRRPSAARRPALTWRPPPRRPAARSVLLSGPRPAVRPAARLPALQAASSPGGGDAGGAVTMETAAAARGSQAVRRPAPGGGRPAASDTAPPGRPEDKHSMTWGTKGLKSEGQRR